MITLTAEIIISENRKFSINETNSKSLNIKIFDREDIKKPSWGIVSNVAKLSFYDSNNEILNLINSGVLNEMVKVEFYLKNTLSNKTEKCGDYYTSTWNYDNDNRLVNVDLVDELQVLQATKINKVPAQKRNNFLAVLYSIVFYSYVLNNLDIDDETSKLLTSIEPNWFYSDSKNAWQILDDFAKTSMLHIFRNANGKTFIRSSV